MIDYLVYLYHETILLEEICAVMDETFTNLIIFYMQFRFTLVTRKSSQSLNDFEELRFVTL